MKLTHIRIIAALGLVGLTGCSLTTGSVVDAAKQGISLAGQQGRVDAVAANLGYSQAPQAPLVRDVYVDNSGVTLTNGVRRVRTYQSVENVVPAASVVQAVTPPLPVVELKGTNVTAGSLGSLLP
jgi:hypothetical protein